MHFNILLTTKKRERIKQISQLFSFSRTIRRIQSHLHETIWKLNLRLYVCTKKKITKGIPKIYL